MNAVNTGSWNDLDSSSFPDAGENVVYTIVVTNEGTVTLHNVQVSDTSGEVSCDKAQPMASLDVGASFGCSAFQQVWRSNTVLLFFFPFPFIVLKNDIGITLRCFTFEFHATCSNFSWRVTIYSALDLFLGGKTTRKSTPTDWRDRALWCSLVRRWKWGWAHWEILPALIGLMTIQRT